MIYVALASLAIALAGISLLGNQLRLQARQHARERALLVNQILHLSGRPWQEAPAEAVHILDDEEPRETLAFPEQYDSDW